VEDSANGVPPDVVAKLRATLTFLQNMRDPETLRAFPLFRIEHGEIVNVDYEDYH
jgi:plasmid maintenance system killer protein